jgi:integrase
MIANRHAWKVGLSAIPDANDARNVILKEPEVLAIVRAAYRDSTEFREYVDVLAVTGARCSQVARLLGSDVQVGLKRLMMPLSKKGRGGKKVTHRLVPISLDLAKRLMGRDGILLRRPDGGPWHKSTHTRRFTKAVEGAGLDPTVITIYALRHSSIVRSLLANVPIRVVAALHDTSVVMIERNYSEYITDHTDDLTRGSLLDTSGVASTLPGNIVSFPKKARKGKRKSA